MENQNQHYGTHESMYVEDPNEQKEFLHSEEGEKPVVTGDPSETAEDHDLNQDTQGAGMADTDSLLDEVEDNNQKEEPDPDEDDDDVNDPESDDPELDDDDEEFEPDDDDLDDIDPDDLDPDDLDLDDDDVIDNDLNTDDKDPGLDEDEDNVTYLK